MVLRLREGDADRLTAEVENALVAAEGGAV
jgi:hypothetical protein